MQPISAQTVVVTDANGLDAGEVQVPTPDGSIPAYRAMPASGSKFPVVLVISEIFGVHAYIQDTCRRLARQGYCAVAPLLYGKYGDVSRMTDAQAIIRDVVARASDEEIHVYPDAPHAFHADYRPTFRKEAAEDGWRRMLDRFKQHGLV